MKITVVGRNMDVGNSLTSYIEDRLSSSINKYLVNVSWGEVILTKQHSHDFHTDIVIHIAGFATIRASSSNEDGYSAFDGALLRIDKQIRKYKDRIKDKRAKHHEDHIEQEMKATKYVIASNSLSEETVLENEAPITIAEKATNIEFLTVSDAIMKMDLMHVPALLFKNKANNRLNIVYYRADGNISWVDYEE